MKKNILITLGVLAPTLLMAAAIIGYQDWQLRGSTPGNPASGYLRVWADNAAGKFKCLNSSGAPCFFDATSGTVTQTIASGTSALGTSAIASGACASAVTTSATGTATTDALIASFNADPTAVTGYIPTTDGMLTIIGFPTANNVNWRVCNNTLASITPGAITVNWRVVR